MKVTFVVRQQRADPPEHRFLDRGRPFECCYTKWAAILILCKFYIHHYK